MKVLISGASIAGPVLAYWLTRYGFTVTLVERAPALRKTGGHAVDLFRPAMDIVERMGVLEQVQHRKTGTERLTLHLEGGTRPIEVELRRILGRSPTGTSRSCATTSARSSTTPPATTPNTSSATPSPRSPRTARSRSSAASRPASTW
ncbi:FAD-dependent monooxygenase [Nonomuraea antimicrobica]